MHTLYCFTVFHICMIVLDLYQTNIKPPFIQELTYQDSRFFCVCCCVHTIVQGHVFSQFLDAVNSKKHFAISWTFSVNTSPQHDLRQWIMTDCKFQLEELWGLDSRQKLSLKFQLFIHRSICYPFLSSISRPIKNHLFLFLHIFFHYPRSCPVEKWICDILISHSAESQQFCGNGKSIWLTPGVRLCCNDKLCSTSWNT